MVVPKVRTTGQGTRLSVEPTDVIRPDRRPHLQTWPHIAPQGSRNQDQELLPLGHNRALRGSGRAVPGPPLARHGFQAARPWATVGGVGQAARGGRPQQPSPPRGQGPPAPRGKARPEVPHSGEEWAPIFPWLPLLLRRQIPLPGASASWTCSEGRGDVCTHGHAWPCLVCLAGFRSDSAGDPDTVKEH